MGQQVAVWMDGAEAKVFHVRADGFDESTVHSPNHHLHRHPKSQLTRTHNHPDDEHRFFRELADTLKDAEQILVLGPSTAKLLFLRYLEKNDPALAARVVGLETADHPTDRQIAAHVRHYFGPPADDSAAR
ncbi:MAG TPA: translational machinery protein [Polyangia bacterium]|nr:translational machinery protein [Polyangia bacterium]